MALLEEEVLPDLAAELATRGLELGPVIGRGAMSVVYRAFDARHQRTLAVKVLALTPGDQDGEVRWSREIRAVAGLRHPNILPLIDSGTTARGTAYFLMPLAEGETLRIRMTRGLLPVAESLRYAREIAEALAHAHSEGLIHRDVKPENVLLESGHAVLADFGLARPIDPGAQQSGQHTQTGIVVGTPAYMSPEQLTAGEGVEGRADLYALGAMLYEMLTGQLPFKATSMPGLMSERLAPTFAPVSGFRPGCPPVIDLIISKALAPDPDSRYENGAAMAADIEQAEHAEVGTPGRRILRAPRWRWMAVLGLAAAVVALVARTVEPTPLDPGRIVVADMRNETGDSTMATVGALASDVISAGLSRIPGLIVINSDLVFGAPRREVDRRIATAPGEGLRALADSSHAATVVSGTYYRQGDRIEVFAEVSDATSGKVLLDLGPLRGALAQPESVLAGIRDSVTAFMRQRRRH